MEIHIDAPYAYYQKDYPLQFENGKMTEVAVKKPDGEIRILLLGGSVAANVGNLSVKDSVLTNEKDNYLQQQIQKQFPDQKIRLINGSDAGYVTEQEFIVLQKYMQYYQPDLVIALHGFNDVESFILNKASDDMKFIPSPIFYGGSWNSPIFRIVENHKRKYTFTGIFDGYYNHLKKAVDFTFTQLNIRKKPLNDTSAVYDNRIKSYALAHGNIVADLNDFCRAKGFKYINFLQPVRFYQPNDSSYHSGKRTPLSNSLSKMYYEIEQVLTNRPYQISLTSMDTTRLQFRDACHTRLAGYRYMADTMAVHVVRVLKEGNETINN
ncbi:MAG TPA: hypothetical protein VM012_06665 [Flavitalea sp.]|nr:hypothetical protein [Flavitalea sp.]